MLVTLYFQKCGGHCGTQGMNPICPSVEDGINVLAELCDSGVGNSAINTARSAVSSILLLSNHSSFGAHTMVCCILKGVFEFKTSLLKHKNIWEVRTFIDY